MQNPHTPSPPYNGKRRGNPDNKKRSLSGNIIYVKSPVTGSHSFPMVSGNPTRDHQKPSGTIGEPVGNPWGTRAKSLIKLREPARNPQENLRDPVGTGQLYFHKPVGIIGNRRGTVPKSLEELREPARNQQENLRDSLGTGQGMPEKTLKSKRTGREPGPRASLN